MPHVTKELIDQLITDLLGEGAFPKEAAHTVTAKTLIPAQYTSTEETQVLHAVAMGDRGFA